MSKRISLWFSAPLLGILAFHMICESMVIPVLVPTLVEASSAAHDMLPGFSGSARKLAYGFVLSVYPVALFFCAPIIGSLSDSVGRKAVLLATLCGAVLGCAVQGFAMEFLSVWLLVLGRVAVGITAGVDGTIQAALLDRCSGKNQKNFYLGATLLAMSLGLMLGPAFAALFIDEGASAFTWSLPFFITAVLFALAALALSFSMPGAARVARSELSRVDWFGGLRDVGILAKSKRSRTLVSVFCLNQVGAGAFFAAVPLVLESKSGFSAREIAAFLSVEGVFSGAVFAFFGPMLLRRASAPKALVASLAVGVATVALPLVSENYWAIPPMQAGGFALSYFVTLAIFSENAPEGRRGWILSVLSSLWGLTMGIGLALCGLLAGIADDLCIAVCLALCAASLALSVRARASM
ncbi:MAG: MFS transporter [Opitutales bacterium]|nr:MFS transporter [Opitutales bacterium]